MYLNLHGSISSKPHISNMQLLKCISINCTFIITIKFCTSMNQYHSLLNKVAANDYCFIFHCQWHISNNVEKLNTTCIYVNNAIHTLYKGPFRSLYSRFFLLVLGGEIYFLVRTLFYINEALLFLSHNNCISILIIQNQCHSFLKRLPSSCL